jgi:hypothetical protein
MGEIIISIFVGGCMVGVGLIIRAEMARNRKIAMKENDEAGIEGGGIDK